MRYRPGDRVDHYEIGELLGAGGWAEVYRAVDRRSGTIVVLKSPDPQLFADPAAFSRYRCEVEIARRLRHPGVQRSVDSGHHRSEPYEVLEYVEGGSLRLVLARHLPKPLPFDLVTDWGAQLASTLSYLHQQGVVHRDLKPENILVASDGMLKIADFGGALQQRARRFTWRPLADAVGTPEYMSPEQIQGKRCDARSDIYALGVILYELVTGVAPFRGGTWQETMAMHLTAWPAAPAALRPDVPAGLEAVIGRALRRRPEDRYQGADELLGDLTDPAAVEGNRATSLPDPPMRGPALATDAALWRVAAVVAGFVGVVGAIVAMSVLLR